MLITNKRRLLALALLFFCASSVFAQQPVTVVNSPSISGNVATTAADGSNVTIGSKTDAKSTATDATSITLMQVLKEISAMEQANNVALTTGTTANTPKPYISTGSAADKFQVKATAAVLAGVSAFNSHATTDAYLKCTNLTSANTTVGSSAVLYRMLIPHASGAVDRSIEWTFDTALTCYIVTGKADSDATSVGANDVVINIGYR